MSWFNKLFTVSKNVVNEKAEGFLDNVVDIKREGNAIIKQIDGKINLLTTRITQAQETVCSNKNEIDTLHLKIITMNEVANKAAKANSDMDTIQALTRVDLFEQTIESLSQSNNILQPVIDQQVGYIQTLNAERNNLKAEIQRLDIEEKAYKLRAEMLGGYDGNSGYNIEDLRNRVKRAKASVEAKEIVSEKLGVNDDKLEDKYQTTSVKPSIEKRLQELKSLNR